MSRALRTKRTVKTKLSRLHHNVGKTDDVRNLGPLERPRLLKSIMSFKESTSLNFTGSAEQLAIKFDQLDGISRQQILSITVMIEGEKVQEQNNICVFATFFIGIVLIIPLFILYSNWFRKKYRSIFVTQMSTYELLTSIITQCQNVKEVHLFIQDNYIDSTKLKTLMNIRKIAKTTIVNVVEKIVFENEGLNVWKHFFNNLQRDRQGESIKAIWGGTKIEIEVNNRIDMIDVNESTQILY